MAILWRNWHYFWQIRRFVRREVRLLPPFAADAPASATEGMSDANFADPRSWQSLGQTICVLRRTRLEGFSSNKTCVFASHEARYAGHHANQKTSR